MSGPSYTDDALLAVRAWLFDRADAATLFGDAVRQSFDEVDVMSDSKGSVRIQHYSERRSGPFDIS